MVPDFSKHRKPSTAIAGCFSPESAPCQASEHIKNFFLQHFSEKVLRSSSKSSTFSEKCLASAANPPTSLSNCLQNTALPAAANSAPTPAVIAKDDTEAQFFDLWLAQPSWSPIIKRADGWITIVNPAGKKVPLVLGTVKSHYRRGIILGKRFGKLTNYLLIDVDINSPFHPRNDGIQLILDAMESLGLCRYLLIRSSDSQGLHIYFPLAEPVSSWAIAYAAHAALTAAGVTIAGGICELFPNKKAFNAEHNGHRLPLQDGSFILNNDFRCTSNAKTVFLQQWQLCAAGQDDKHLAEQLVQKPLPKPKRIAIGPLPPIAWTDKGQSNEVMKRLVNYGHEVIGHSTIQSLSDWIVAVAPQLPGFHHFASKESRNDLTRRNWAYRWAKSHFKAARSYVAKSSSNHNATVAAEALERLLIALNRIVVSGKLGIKKLWHSLSDISMELFGVGFGWKLFQKHRKLILEKVSDSRKLGLSSNEKETKSILSSEPAKPRDSRAEEGLKKHLAGLSTARWMTPIQNEDLRPSTTPSAQQSPGSIQGAELAMGTAVIFQQPGSAVEGVQTRVTGKTIRPDGTLLYRLEKCAEGKPLMVSRDCLTVVADAPRSPQSEIKATAAQLLQVLGKACPFVGPGLWTVRRSEVSPRAWGRLLKLVSTAPL